MRRGFLLGKFMPPHKGHVYMCEFAQQYCDELTILVSTQPSEPMDGYLRAAWMKALFPKARIVHLHEQVPQDPSERADFWDVWRAICRKAHPEKIDYVFASEEYGRRLARELDAAFVPVDIGRAAVPVSATKIRENPGAFWDYIPAVVRPHYTKKICLFGPESTGKTTLANQLAAHYRTVCVPEYGRLYTETFGLECEREDLINIAHGHRAATAALLPEARRYLILDTDELMTALWAEMLLGERLPELDAFDHYADLYLLCDIDIPWEDDGNRYFPDDARRKKFFDLCKDELDKRKLPYVCLSGAGRLEQAVAAIDQRFR